MPEATNTGPLPLYLGVTGHRDLRAEDVPRLREIVAAILAGFKRRLPHTQVVLLSPLADGADRLTADVALSAGVAVHAVLPMEVSKFRLTLVDEQSRHEFDELFRRVSLSFVAPQMNHEIEPESADDDQCYANCGAYIVAHCVQLIAFWDGEESGESAGTSQDVHFMLEGLSEPVIARRNELDPPLTGPVIHIVTPREKNPKPALEPFSTRILYPRFVNANESHAVYDEVLDHIESFNADAVGRAGPSGIKMDPDSLRRSAEQTAEHYQRKTRHLLLTMLLLVFSAAAAFNLYTGGFQKSPPTLAVYFVLTLIAFLAYRSSAKGAWQDRYQDYRTLAEALRVAYFWQRSEIAASAADEVERLLRGEISWLPVAIRGLVDSWRARSAHAESTAALRDVYDEWVADQAAWYQRRIEEKNLYSKRNGYLATAAFVCVEAVTFGTLLPWLEHNDLLKRSFVLASGLIAVIAALIGYYADRRGWSEELREYQRVGALFERARLQISPMLVETVLSPAEQRRVRNMLYDLGCEALRENIAWRNLHRLRPIKLPRA